jgi:hypothetical protein
MSFTSCHMQLQCPTQLRKQIRMHLTTSSQPHDTNFNKIAFID